MQKIEINILLEISMLRKTILEDLKIAMKAGDTQTRDTLRMLDSIIKNEEISVGKREEGLSDDSVIGLVKRAIKQRKDAALQYKEAGRMELAQQEEGEMQIIEKYLPLQMSDEELKALLEGVVVDFGAKSPSDIGQVMGKAMGMVGDRADGARVKTIISEILTAQ